MPPVPPAPPLEIPVVGKPTVFFPVEVRFVESSNNPFLSEQFDFVPPWTFWAEGGAESLFRFFPSFFLPDAWLCPDIFATFSGSGFVPVGLQVPDLVTETESVESAMMEDGI
jgi:hypothetical protein